MPRRLSTLLVLGFTIVLATAAMAGEGNGRPRGDLTPMSIAVLGDAPYASSQYADIDLLIDDVNADPDVSLVVHLGDTKTGADECSDEHLLFVLDMFEAFDDALYYTPGDNEWTDCHRDSSGDHNPLDRLDAIREVYFTHPGKAQGGGPHFTVRTQADSGFPENQTWYQSGVQIGLVHVVGSNNGMQPWALGYDDHDLPGQRIAEVEARTAAAVDWLDTIFDAAEWKDAAGILLIWHADMWAVFEHSGGDDMSGSTPVAEKLAERVDAYGLPVLLVNGDTHDFYQWKPLSDSDTHPLAPFYLWRGTDLSMVNSTYYHGVGGGIENLTQVVFEVWDRFSPEPAGLAAEDFGWLEVLIDPNEPDVFSIEQHFVDAPTP